MTHHNKTTAAWKLRKTGPDSVTFFGEWKVNSRGYLCGDGPNLPPDTCGVGSYYCVVAEEALPPEAWRLNGWKPFDRIVLTNYDGGHTFVRMPAAKAAHLPAGHWFPATLVPQFDYKGKCYSVETTFPKNITPRDYSHSHRCEALAAIKRTHVPIVPEYSEEITTNCLGTLDISKEDGEDDWAGSSNGPATPPLGYYNVVASSNSIDTYWLNLSIRVGDTLEFEGFAYCLVPAIPEIEWPDPL